MTGIWAETGGRWRRATAVRFAQEVELHDLIEQTPEMLPLAGVPRLAILGREVRCGSGYADLVGVEADSGRPVVIEIKLATNTDRRQVLTQVLGYAAYLRRLDLAGFRQLLAPHLGPAGMPSLEAAATAATQDALLDESRFAARLSAALEDGRLRCVIVLDHATSDLIELVGYLQEVTNDRLSLDLITVKGYDIDGRRVLVPQLVEPDRTQVTAAAGPTVDTAKPSSYVTKGAGVFEESIASAPSDQQLVLRRLLTWARSLEADRLATLYTSTGKGRWVLNLRLPGQERAMLSIWNDRAVSLNPYRTVMTQEAPSALAALEVSGYGPIGQGTSIKGDYPDSLLDLLRQAYVEASMPSTVG